MTTELREYRIAAGHLDDFVAAWSSGVVPLREAHGFRIDGAWVDRDGHRFIWLLSLDGSAEDFERRDAGYYASTERASLTPDPAQWIEEANTAIVDSII